MRFVFFLITFLGEPSDLMKLTNLTVSRSKFSGINGEYGGSFECDAVCVKISKAYGIIASNTSGKLNNCDVERSGWSGIISDCLTGKYL